MDNWYVLNSKPHKERQVAEYLRGRGVQVYLPLVRVNPINPRASHERPYFPSYLFTKIDIEATGINAIQWAPGIKDLVRFGGQPASVSDNFVSALRRRLSEISAAGGEFFDGLQQGDHVRITQGPFAGYEALFDRRLSGEDRVRILLTFLGERTRMEIGAGAVERIRVS